MPRDTLALLWDIHECAEAVAEYIAGLDRAAFFADRMRQDAVERRFITIGEALNSLRQDAPELAARVSDLGPAIGLRNHLTHEYFHVTASIVWDTAVRDLPELRRTVESLIAELDPPAAGTSGEAEEKKDEAEWQPPEPSPLDKTDGTAE